MGAIGPRLTKPVRLEIVGDRLRATLEVASRNGQPHAVSASLTEHGRILDLQSQSDTWRAGTTGDRQLDALIVEAIDQAFITARNAVTIAELQRRIHFRGRRYRR